MAVCEEKLSHWQSKVASNEGLIVCPEAATCVGALETMLADGTVGADERVVIVNTAAGQKYFDGSVPNVETIDLNQETDWDSFEEQFLGSPNAV